MALFDNSNIKLDVLKKRAFNYRWAEVPDGVIPLTAAIRIIRLLLKFRKQ